jgi:hypothetical protein
MLIVSPSGQARVGLLSTAGATMTCVPASSASRLIEQHREPWEAPMPRPEAATIELTAPGLDGRTPDGKRVRAAAKPVCYAPAGSLVIAIRAVWPCAARQRAAMLTGRAGIREGGGSPWTE